VGVYKKSQLVSQGRAFSHGECARNCSGYEPRDSCGDRREKWCAGGDGDEPADQPSGKRFQAYCAVINYLDKEPAERAKRRANHPVEENETDYVVDREFGPNKPHQPRQHRDRKRDGPNKRGNRFSGSSDERTSFHDKNRKHAGPYGNAHY
tara:strand:+ start:173082 stop:173534 length:453 start_codon:yes stop_codon:yes gene_type:complete